MQYLLKFQKNVLMTVNFPEKNEIIDLVRQEQNLEEFIFEKIARNQFNIRIRRLKYVSYYSKSS